MVARRPILSLVLVALASLAAVSQLAFVTSPLQSASSSSRRAGFLAAIAAVGVGPAVLPDAPAFAVPSGPPPSLQVTGAPERRAAMAGIWTIVPGKELNQRAVYKRDGEDYYLMVNDCGGFQVSDSITGECKGFATEKKGAWTVDGVYLKDFKVKPVKKNDVAAAAPEESSGFGFPSFSFNLPKNPTEPQTESQVLDNAFRGEDTTVLSYIKSKGGDSFLENVMKLSDDEDKVASSLEARLAARR
mmetsp:Transcript_6496/g.24228  ORF Transcript_6496/g.24228 Transcript_6496/m.24228 type:complete len:245 (+) Transcript_6496:100-834(+)